MRLDLICVLLTVLCLCFIAPVSAVNMQIPALPPTQEVNLSEFNFFEDNTFDIKGFLKDGVLSPFLSVFGDYFYVIIYGLVLLLVYMRSRNLTLTGMLVAISLPIWSIYLPQTVFIPLLLVIILGIGVCLYRLFKNKN